MEAGMKEEFSDAQMADFLRRSYFVVDGLWFVKTEESSGLDNAMEMDESVWKVMSKIQARKAKSMLGIDGGSVGDLARAFQLKLASEGYDYEIEHTKEGVQITISSCPWYDILVSSGRTAIAETIADRICAREFAGWAAEFAGDVKHKIEKRLCVESDGCSCCEMVFSDGAE
jgi:hypothetical protein